MDNEVEKIYSVFKTLDLTANELKTNVYNNKEDYLAKKKSILEPFIFNSLKELYSSHLKDYWNSAQIPYVSDKAIIIIERRCHPNLEFILHNACYFARGYSIHIFCSKANLSFIEAICGSQIKNIHIHTIFFNIGTSEDGWMEYNKLLKTKRFWEFLKEEYLLLLEIDTYLLQHIPESIYEYDYVASAWEWLISEPGGGGLSYRKRSVMIKICELDNTLLDICTMQDSFSSTGVKILEAKYSHNFFTESTFIEGAIGLHQWWTFYNVGMTKDIIKHHLTLKL